VVFGDKVSWIPESHVGIHGSWLVQALNSHVTTSVFSVIEYKKRSQTLKIIPYRWFRYALLVPTLARVHFLNLKALVCILISAGSTWDIGTKSRYQHLSKSRGSRVQVSQFWLHEHDSSRYLYLNDISDCFSI
jgi:hypothetical protein